MQTVANCMAQSHGCTCSSQQFRNNLKLRKTKCSAQYVEKCIALDATDTFAQLGQVQVEHFGRIRKPNNSAEQFGEFGCRIGGGGPGVAKWYCHMVGKLLLPLDVAHAFDGWCNI